MNLSVYEKAIFVGEALGPFYLMDPTDENIQAAFLAFKDIQVDEAANDWPFVDRLCAQELIGKMKASLSCSCFGEQTKNADDLIAEYRRLFVGPAHKPTPPWGSVYTDPESVVFGESTLALRQWLRKTGIERLGANSTPEDHFGLMLLLMSWIAENNPEQLEDYLRLHLLTWSSHFLSLFAQSAQHPFYQGLAQLSQASLEGIQKAMQIEVEYPRFYR